MASKHFVEPARPTAPSLLNRIMRGIIFTIVSVIGIPIIAFVAIRNWNAFYLNISSAFKPSIRLNAMFKDQELEQKIWQTEIGQLYCENLEYQKQEGYCAPTTVRVILKSISEIPTSSYPEMKSGGSIPEQIVQKIDSTGYTASQIIHGSDGFESFLKTIRLSNNPKYRISANFLRSSLFGFSKPIFLPHNILLGLFGGHFSPIVGYDEEANMVAIFDVNHNYGLYFVTPQDLYRAVNTYDIQSGKVRALVMTEILKGDNRSKTITVFT